MKIVSPTGTNFIFVGADEPSSNVGPWLRDGNSWWVFSDDVKRYVPISIADSETRWFWMGNAVPANSTPPVWLKTTADQTSTSASFGTPIGWYVFNGTNWVPYVGIVLSGATADRPAAPVEFQQFYDSDISCLIWWERGQWRTVSGVPGDCKFVAFSTLVDALNFNPGWSLFGASNQSFRGRIPMQAAADSGGANPLTVDAGVAVRQAFEVFGQTDGVKIDNTSPVPYPPQVALYFLVKT